MGFVLVRMSPPKPLYFYLMVRFCDTVAHKDAPISRPVLSGSVCIGKTSGEQVCVWMVAQVLRLSFNNSGYRLFLNDSFWTSSISP